MIFFYFKNSAEFDDIYRLLGWSKLGKRVVGMVLSLLLCANVENLLVNKNNDEIDLIYFSYNEILNCINTNKSKKLTVFKKPCAHKFKFD